MPYLRNQSSDLLHVLSQDGVFWNGGSNGSIWFEQVQDGVRRHLGKISDSHISTTSRPIHFMFGSRVGISGTADLMALFPVRTNPRWRPPTFWRNFKWPYLRNGSTDPLLLSVQNLQLLCCSL